MNLKYLCLSALFILCIASASVFAQDSNAGKQLAVVSAGAGAVTWQPQIQYDHAVLTVSEPGGAVIRREFKAGAAVYFRLTDKQENPLPEGHYTYQLELVPNVSTGVRHILEDARQKGNSDEVVQDLKSRGLLPNGPTIQYGAFTVKGGAALTGAPGETMGEPQSAQPGQRPHTQGVITPQDQVIADDEIVQGSLCVGLDCVNNESFGFDTIRLKENNTRIKFDDTSTAGGFPNHSWQLTANDSASGGANKFSIEDTTAGTVPFTVTGSSPTNSIFVDSSGRVGLGTSTPVLNLHEVKSDTPAFRLEQNSSGGFTAQTWDIAGNESNFFVRDVTGGSHLPFRIRPGAPTSSIDISGSGNVGVGTASPVQKLHVSQNTDGITEALVENTTTGTSSQAQVQVKSDSAILSFETHATTRTISRFGVTLGGWGEILGQTGNGLAIGTFSAVPLIIGTNSADVIHVTASGNVGIGTASPGGKLDVNGQIFQRGALLHADYVFEPSYKLESIDQHSKYMWQNKHLPAVPGRKVDAQGREVVEVGAEQRGILEELEKAHIYIEQLNQKLDNKDTELARLTALVDQQQKTLDELARKVAALENQK